MNDGYVPRIFLRPIGSPLTLGMSGLAIASLVQSGVELKWIATTDRAHAGLLLIAVPFVLQLIACVFSYLGRDGATGAAIGLLATCWLAIGLIDLASPPGTTSGVLGLLLLAAGGALLLSSAAIAVAKPLPAVVIALAGLRFAGAAIYQLGGPEFWQDIAGIIGLVLCGLAAYCLLAFELEGQLRRPLLPTFRRGPGADGIGEGPGAQLDGIANEAGVRQTT